jgi:hypothetical protein
MNARRLLGFLILWGGYSVGVFGYATFREASSAAVKLTFSDCVLPTHRSTYVTAMTTPKASINPNTGKPASPGLNVTPAGLQNAEALAQNECAKSSTSAACLNAQQQVKDIKNGATA